MVLCSAYPGACIYCIIVLVVCLITTGGDSRVVVWCSVDGWKVLVLHDPSH